MERQRGKKQCAKNQPRIGEEGRTVPMESWKEGEVRKPLRVVEEEEVSSSSMV